MDLAGTLEETEANKGPRAYNLKVSYRRLEGWRQDNLNCYI